MMKRVIPGVFLVFVASCGASGSSPTTPNQTASDSADPQDTAPTGPPKDIDCGDFTTCATGTDGLVRCWGHDKEGELGGGGSGGRLKRGVVPGVGRVRQVALASRFG